MNRTAGPKCLVSTAQRFPKRLRLWNLARKFDRRCSSHVDHSGWISFRSRSTMSEACPLPRRVEPSPHSSVWLMFSYSLWSWIRAARFRIGSSPMRGSSWQMHEYASANRSYFVCRWLGNTNVSWCHIPLDCHRGKLDIRYSA